MPQPMLIMAAFMLAACDSAVVPDAVETSPTDSSSLDLSLTQGHDDADHTEVAPGVYESGKIEYLPSDLGLDKDTTEEDLLLATQRDAAPRIPAANNSYCYNSDYNNYSQNINKSLFKERPTFYGYASTYAYAHGSWRARCDSDLSIDATIYTRDYAYSSDGAYANVGTTYEVSAHCCL
jgi:hypothetical protein